MTLVQDQLDGESLFPSKIRVPFPKKICSITKTILKRPYRVYEHIYSWARRHTSTPASSNASSSPSSLASLTAGELVPLQELIELTSEDLRRKPLHASDPVLPQNCCAVEDDLFFLDCGGGLPQCVPPMRVSYLPLCCSLCAHPLYAAAVSLDFSSLRVFFFAHVPIGLAGGVHLHCGTLLL
ncbi:hypothetical protein HPB48_003370 [Haemaphysalis longicornis]|uniref:Uncharacterized protein n=1 Tax=Haemaphysalis longicornis TaxID=44386 RepID=A0A9J6G2I7_HAELO|nr:hypothetical protein HPB48_003370 [Haemaphysalis longicornis]